MNRRSRLYIFFLGLGTLLAACVPQQTPPTPDAGRANFERFVALGGHLMSGYQDGALYLDGQQHAIPELLAIQFRHANGGPFSTPLMPEGEGLGLNVKPWESLFQTRSLMGNRVDCEGVESIGPVKDTFGLASAGNYLDAFPTAVQNLSAPFAGLRDLDNPALGLALGAGGTQPFYNRFASSPGTSTLLQQAVNQDPTFFVMWPGLQDMYDWASNGGTPADLDPAAFRQKLDSILGALTANGSKGAIANLPDISHMPFFTTIPTRSLTLDQQLADSLNQIYALGGLNVGFVEGDNGFIVADPNEAQGLRQLTDDDYFTLTVPLDSMRCFFMGVLFNLIPDRYSLLADEIAQLRGWIDQMNTAIADLAAQYDLALVDLRSYYQRLDAGIVVDAIDFNTTFVSGGFFSLDGFTVTPRGAGLIANEYISAINAHYDASIPPVRVDFLRGVLFP